MNETRARAESSRPRRIAFLTTLGVNVGDEYIREGIRACLDRLGEPYTPLLVNKHDPSSLHAPRDTESMAAGDKLRDCDLVIQSGAPVYWWHPPGVHNSTTAEWHEWAWEQRILPAGPDSPELWNLGAGSCQPWGDDGEGFVRDARCASFAQRAGRRAAITTVRDPLASRMLNRLKVPHHCLPCPAFLAAERWPAPPHQDRLIGVNAMPLGGHYRLDRELDPLHWVETLDRLVRLLRQQGDLLFVCHDEEEARLARALRAPGELIFHSPSFRDYLDLLPRLHALFANRIHAAVTAAGFGVPAVLAGNDSRARIGEWIGLRVERSASLDAENVAGEMERLMRDRSQETARLRRLREESMERYTLLMRSRIAPLRDRPDWRRTPAQPGESVLRRWLAQNPDDQGWPRQLGLRSYWFLPESGFHAAEPYAGEWLRWMEPRASLRIPAPLGRGCRELHLQFWPVHPGGHSFTLRVNGEVALESGMESGSWQGAVVLPESDEFTFEFESKRIECDDVRELGLALRRLEVRTSGSHTGVTPAPAEGGERGSEKGQIS